MPRRIALVLAGAAAAAVLTSAQVMRVDGFRGTVVNVRQEAGRTLTVDLIRWSTDEERDKLTAAVDGTGDTTLLDALKAMPTVGYIWTGESVGYQVRYAHRLSLADGGERVILATDRRLGSYQITPWQPDGAAPDVDYPFTLIEMRLQRNGVGEGKMSLTTKVAADAEAKTIALESYAAAPVLLKDVRHTPAT
ncbi:MAG: hypothetical protein HY657_11720 [Acidobacteria bacterium]|nr:hypothetical protein [Acidobacteriota bacterium]